MNRRHALRFENGERRGETLALDAGEADSLSLGRRAGNGIVVQDPSVSGRHAEFAFDDQGVTVRDLGSTNGTRVGDERISEQRLAHGDTLHFGNVRATFLDALIEAPVPAPSPSAPPEPAARKRPSPAGPSEAGGRPRPAARKGSAAAPGARAEDAGDDVHTVSADVLARTEGSKGRFSPLTLALLLVLAGGGAGAWFWLQPGSGGPAGSSERAVIEVPGNLLVQGYSFEDVAVDGREFEATWQDRWEVPDAAPVAFTVDRAARRSGEQGLSATFAGGEGAEHRSEALAATRGAEYEALAWARSDGAFASVGLRFESAAGTARPVTVWSPRSQSDSYEPVQVNAAVPPGYDRVRAVLHGKALSETSGAPDGSEAPAGSSSWVEFDDASLVVAGQAEGAARPARIGEYELSVLGNNQLFNLFKIDRVLVSGLTVETGSGRASFAREQNEVGLRLSPGTTEAGRLSFFAEPGLVAGGVATVAAADPDGASTGAAAYRTHQIEFTREGVTAVLLGAGRELVRLGFSTPLTLTGAPSAGSDGAGESGRARPGFRFTAELPPGADIHVQLVFNAERNEAQTLARAARQAEQAGENGRAAGLWDRLLNEFPFDAELLGEAVAARSRLVEQGLARLRDQARAVERADFFRLVDDYRSCRADTAELADTYAGTEVAAGARELIERIDTRLEVLEGELERHERARLEAIARTLEAGDSPLLAQRVEAYLETHFVEPAPQPGAAPQQERP